MFSFLLFVHVILAIVIIFLVIIQKGKGSSIGAAFGAGSAGSVFGARGATSFVQKTTYGLAFLFFVTSIILSYLSTNKINEPKPIEKLLIPSTDAPELDSELDSSPDFGIELPNDAKTPVAPEDSPEVP